MNTLEKHINNADTYGITIQGNAATGKTKLIKDTIKHIKETSFGFNDDIIILSNKNEYNSPHIATTHCKISPTLLKAFLSQCVANHKVPNLLINKTCSKSTFKRIFKATSQLPRYSLYDRTLIFDDFTFIFPKNLSLISLHNTLPIFVFQNTKSLTRNSQEMTLRFCNKSIKVTT